MRYEFMQYIDEFGRMRERDVLIIECDVCEEEVACSNFTNMCYCGADYDSHGDRLTDRSQWGIETGETWQDIMH